ncbi:MAG TPA: phosphatidylserine/phosphatidylglycerophosphate/cardiolipin synthase family protein [Holophagaceae bacterium]|nr:phosphatidylserine/phosphatidylglycerophosphate/cardiolipin synthase family protein [Holophagaceae bacterium]
MDAARALSRLPDPAAVLRRRSFLRLAHRMALPLREGNAVALLEGGGAQLEATKALIRGARSSLLFEMYIWADDPVGREIAELLVDAVRRGVLVAGVVDAVGSWGADLLLADLRAAGLRIQSFHPVAPWRPMQVWNRRNHRKLLLADGDEAVVGSGNWGLDYATEQNTAAFVDLGVALRGPSVADLVEDFRTVWRRADGGALELPPPAPQPPRWQAPWLENATVQLVSSAGRSGHRALRRHLLTLLRQTQEELLVVNAYFVPGAALMRRLRRMARRGATVRILLPGASDQPFVQAAGRSTYAPLLAAGVRILERKGRILHAKAALMDGETALIGTANLDPRSFRHNLELNLLIRHPDLGPKLRDLFEAQAARSEEITLEAWKKRSPASRLWERFAYLFRWWL